jgi:hypothetical protein
MPRALKKIEPRKLQVVLELVECGRKWSAKAQVIQGVSLDRESDVAMPQEAESLGIACEEAILHGLARVVGVTRQ